MSYVKLTGRKNRHTSWVSEIILERDSDGNPSKVVRRDIPVDLTKDEQEKLESRGYTFESSSKAEANEVKEDSSITTSGDVVGSAPIFGRLDTGEANQSSDDDITNKK